MSDQGRLQAKLDESQKRRYREVFPAFHVAPLGKRRSKVKIGGCQVDVEAQRSDEFKKGQRVTVVQSSAGGGATILDGPPGVEGPIIQGQPVRVKGMGFSPPPVPPYVVFVRDGNTSTSTTYAITLGAEGNPIEIIDSRVLGLEALFGIMWGNTFVVGFRDSVSGDTRQGLRAWNPFAKQLNTYNYNQPPEFNGIVASTSGPCVGRDGRLYWVEMDFDDGLETHDWVLISTEDRSLNGLDRFLSLTNDNDSLDPPTLDAINPTFLAGVGSSAQIQQAIWDAGADIIRGHFVIEYFSTTANPDQPSKTLLRVNLHKATPASSFETFISSASPNFPSPSIPYSHNGFWAQFGPDPATQCALYGTETPQGVNVWPTSSPTDHGASTDRIFIVGSLHEDGDYVSLCRLRPTTTDGQGSLRFGPPTGSPSVTVVNIPALDAFVGNPGTYVLVGGGKVSALPEVSITAPPEGSSFVFGETTNFIGSAFSAEFGDISSDLTWNSDLDGPLGPIGGGASIFVKLTVGDHVVTAAVEDPNAKTGQATIRVTVTAV